MSPLLRFLLLALVLLNLAFVQLTGAVGDQWLLALWCAAAMAPVFVRWHDRLLYRAAWNGTVLVAFAFLVNDAMTSGLLHMLEDGLLLAALCQVHLLNNVGERQRPDLLFFNSFLIAFVTSFFCSDLGWSLCFCGYAAVLVPALQLFVALPRTGQLEAAVARAVLRDGLPRSAVALALTAVVFFVWPRDFHREGWIGDALQLGGQPMVAFADEVRLDRDTTPMLSNAVVLRIRGRKEQVPAHWRGVTFVEFDGAGWQPFRVIEFGTRTATDPLWTAVGRDTWRRPFEVESDAIELHLRDPGAGRLFLPVDACEITLPPTGPFLLLDPKADAIVALGTDAVGTDEVVATVRIGRAPAPQKLSPRARNLLTRLPARLPAALTGLAEQLRRELPTDSGPEAIAEHSRQWLAEHRQYALPGTPNAARSLDDFLLGTGGGHCEYFATTLALLLRLQGLPCRLVGGYLAHEWDAQEGEIVVRQRDAHAWVEVLSPGIGWMTLDATPGGPADAAPIATTWWEHAVAAMREGWGKIAAFGQDDRRALLAYLLALPGEVLAAALGRPVTTIAIGALLAAIVMVRRSRRRGPPTVEALQRAVRRAQLEAKPGETPRELLARARQGTTPGDLVAQLEVAVVAHEAARYARTGARADSPRG